MGPDDLLMALARELAIELVPPLSRHQVLSSLQEGLLRHAEAGRPVLVCIDEAQATRMATLESLRLLSNLETEKRKLLQVVLFGQPELMVRLNAKNTRQILTRVSFHAVLRPLGWQEMNAYVRHRLKVAGTEAAVLSPLASFALWRASRGLPRLDNIIAAKAMMLAYGRGEQQVARHHVKAAAADTLAARKGVSAGMLAWGLALLGLAAAAAASMHFLR